MAVEGIVRKLLAGERPASGARAATRALSLADYDALFAGRTIHTGFRGADDLAQPLYRRLLGDAYAELPPRVQQLHGATAARRWSGRASVRRGRGLLGRLAGAILGFPPPSVDTPVTVTFTPEQSRWGPAERWTRDFGGSRFASLQYAGTGKNDRLLVERFGPIAAAMALVADGDCLNLILRRWSLFGIPMPNAMLPGGTTFETDEGDQFRFEVEVRMPLVGFIAGYQGMLEPD